MLALLRPILADVNRELRRRLYVASLLPEGDPGPFTTAATRRALRAIEAIIADGYKALGDKLQTDLLDIAEREIAYGAAALREAVPVAIALDPQLISPDILRQLIAEKPMQGGLVGEWFQKTGKRSLVRSAMRENQKIINQKIASGALTGQPIDKTVRQIAPLMKQVARRHLRAVVDTATKHVVSEAREAFFDANAGDDGVIKGYQWLSTLDLRTTKRLCVPRDGKRYTVDKQPVGHSLSWKAGPGRLHWGCRSAQTAILKSWKELGIDAKELEPGERASMDGSVSDKTNARDFLRNRQWTKPELEEMFGKRRAAKILDGRLSVDSALRQVGINVPGRVPSIHELRRASLRDFESGHIVSKREHLLALDRNGNIVGQTVGTKDRVTMTESIRNKIANGGTLTHNHPNGAPFSPQDAQAAIKHNLGEIRAVARSGGKDWAYSLKPGSSGWVPASDFTKAFAPLMSEYEALKAAGQFTNTLEQIEWVHREWQKIAKSLGLLYSRSSLS